MVALVTERFAGSDKFKVPNELVWFLSNALAEFDPMGFSAGFARGFCQVSHPLSHALILRE